MHDRKFIRIILLLMGALGLFACQALPGALGVLAAPTATALPPTPTTEPPTPTPQPSLVLVDQETHESYTDPLYTIDARWPTLEWGQDSRVDVFNQTINDWIQETFDSFKKSVLDLEVPELADQSSSIQIDYKVLNTDPDLLSIQLHVTTYIAGAAHPGHFSHAINYVVREGKLLQLSDLFAPDAEYLQDISTFCIDSLTSRNLLSWEEGALPMPENYQVWNISPEGLVITFDEYQIAPYAAGPQTVLIPYSHFNGMLRQDGPLTPLLTQ